MPTFTVNGKTYNNPVEFALDKIGGRWKMPILWRLNQRIWRYNELKRELGHISHKMLSKQLRELEADALIMRKVYAEIPPKVEYSLTKKGQMCIPVIEELRSIGKKLLQSEEKQ